MMRPLTLILNLLVCSGFSYLVAQQVQSISVLEFGPDGTLSIGDSKSATIFAYNLNDNQENHPEKAPSVTDLESHIGAFLGSEASDILIHDMAVNPLSKNTYFSVSRARSQWTSRWQLANDLYDAQILVRLAPDGGLTDVQLSDHSFTSLTLPNPVSHDKEHRWKKGTKLRVDAITDIALKNGTLYVAGLSNEEFASAMWMTPYPFAGEAALSTVEIYHGAHGEYETHAPIRTLLPYTLDAKEHLIAAYLCTPLVTFAKDQLKDGVHVKGRTVAEFGSGNYPIDMLEYQLDGEDYILMSNSQLPLMVIEPKKLAAYEGEIVDPVEGYTAGLEYTAKAGAGIYFLADFDDKHILATQRLANGKLALQPLTKSRLMP